MNNKRFLIIHHTGGTDSDPLADTSHHTFDIVNNWHRQLWNFKSSLGYYIGYHFFINKDGEIKQGREVDEEGAHCKGLNSESIGICLAGNFDRYPGMENHKPTEFQIIALKNIIKGLREKYNIPFKNIVPHRFFASKTCYGKNLSDSWARDLLREEQEEELKKQIAIIRKMLEVYQAILRLYYKMRGIISQNE